MIAYNLTRREDRVRKAETLKEEIAAVDAGT